MAAAPDLAEPEVCRVILGLVDAQLWPYLRDMWVLMINFYEKLGVTLLNLPDSVATIPTFNN